MDIRSVGETKAEQLRKGFPPSPPQRRLNLEYPQHGFDVLNEAPKSVTTRKNGVRDVCAWICAVPGGQRQDFPLHTLVFGCG